MNAQKNLASGYLQQATDGVMLGLSALSVGDSVVSLASLGVTACTGIPTPTLPPVMGIINKLGEALYRNYKHNQAKNVSAYFPQLAYVDWMAEALAWAFANGYAQQISDLKEDSAKEFAECLNMRVLSLFQSGCITMQEPLLHQLFMHLRRMAFKRMEKQGGSYHVGPHKSLGIQYKLALPLLRHTRLFLQQQTDGCIKRIISTHYTDGGIIGKTGVCSPDGVFYSWDEDQAQSAKDVSKMGKQQLSKGSKEGDKATKALVKTQKRNMAKTPKGKTRTNKYGYQRMEDMRLVKKIKDEWHLRPQHSNTDLSLAQTAFFTVPEVIEDNKLWTAVAPEDYDKLLYEGMYKPSSQ